MPLIHKSIPIRSSTFNADCSLVVTEGKHCPEGTIDDDTLIGVQGGGARNDCINFMLMICSGLHSY